jgi:ribonuclease HII
MLHVGIDEAGYGPLLGPLAIVMVSAEVGIGIDPASAFAAAGVPVGDSKRIHTSGDIAAIEAVALAGLTWLMGRAPGTAAELFAQLGEAEANRGDPWMGGAESVMLPVAAPDIVAWRIPGIAPHAVSGALVHPDAMNQASAAGVNRAALQLERIGGLLRGLPCRPQVDIICDRLGGRRYYRDFLAAVWPDSMVLVEDEAVARSAYRAMHGVGEIRAAFAVDGEQASPFVALASCIAKYARELHMLLFNRWWCQSVPGLRATAGYGSDAHRWLGDLGEARVASARSRLVRYGAPT